MRWAVGSWQLAGVARAVARSLLAVLLVLGSAFLWIGLPVLGCLLAGELTTTPVGFLFAVLGGVPLSMVVFGFLLHRVNVVYEGLRGRESGRPPRSAWLGSVSGERASHRRAREPRPLLDVAMTASAILALVLLLVWFFFFAHQFLAPMQ